MLSRHKLTLCKQSDNAIGFIIQLYWQQYSSKSVSVNQGHITFGFDVMPGLLVLNDELSSLVMMYVTFRPDMFSNTVRF